MSLPNNIRKSPKTWRCEFIPHQVRAKGIERKELDPFPRAFLAEIGIRVNMINPDAVFGSDEISSKLWDLIGPERMKSRGLDYEGLKEYYRNRNLLKAGVLAEHVGNAVVFFATEQTPTTGASLPVDGGIPAAFPR